MAEPITFLGVNKEIKPDSQNEELVIPVASTANSWVSCWRLSEEELARVLETGRVWVYLKGRNHPVLSVFADEPIEQ